MLGSKGFRCHNTFLESQQGGLHRGLVLYRDMTLGVATAALQWETEVCREKVFTVAIGFGCLVSRHSLGVMTGPSLGANS